MKQLSNNFTSPEQSRRLLEYGVPADSADCVFEKKQNGTQFIMSKTPDVIPQKMELCWKGNNRIPCWSVGRLIEIYCIIKGQYIMIHGGYPLIPVLVNAFEAETDLDFSKLEEKL